MPVAPAARSSVRETGGDRVWTTKDTKFHESEPDEMKINLLVGIIIALLAPREHGFAESADKSVRGAAQPAEKGNVSAFDEAEKKLFGVLVPQGWTYMFGQEL